MKTTSNWPLILFAITILNGTGAYAQSRGATSSIVLKGTSSGGVLTLTQAPGMSRPYFAITNRSGESASLVIDRIANGLRTCVECPESYRKGVVSSSDDTLVMGYGFLNELCSSWILGGTETGFGIPSAPLGLSAFVKDGAANIQWNNPPEGYDAIGIICDGLPVISIPGDRTNYLVKFGQLAPPLRGTNGASIFVLGQKNGTPSNGTGILAKKQCQQTLMIVPFTDGLAPGLQPWMHITDASSLDFEQGDLAKEDIGKGKLFYQILKGHGRFTGGVSRRFFGLTSGHTYRVSARLNTFQATRERWTFSFHAIYNPIDGKDLTSAQMAGTVALPNGTRGQTAGQIAKYDAAITTDGKWITRSSESVDPENINADITLPDGFDSITLWFRLQGTNVTDSLVGIDSLTIEDLSVP